MVRRNGKRKFINGESRSQPASRSAASLLPGGGREGAWPGAGREPSGADCRSRGVAGPGGLQVQGGCRSRAPALQKRRNSWNRQGDKCNNHQMEKKKIPVEDD